jgi:hypothetical protein
VQNSCKPGHGVSYQLRHGNIPGTNVPSTRKDSISSSSSRTVVSWIPGRHTNLMTLASRAPVTALERTSSASSSKTSSKDSLTGQLLRTASDRAGACSKPDIGVSSPSRALCHSKHRHMYQPGFTRPCAQPHSFPRSRPPRSRLPGFRRPRLVSQML